MKRYYFIVLVMLLKGYASGQTAKSYYSAGLIKMVSKQYKEALSDFNKAIKIDNKFVDAYFNRGIVYEKLDEINKAINDYSKVISLQPNMYQAYNNRGLLYFGISDYNKAIKDFSTSIRIKDNYAFTYLYRSNTYLVLGKIDLAKADAEKVIELLPNYFKAHQILAQIAFIQKDYKKSLKHYNFLCESQSEEADNFLGRARVYDALQNREKACEDFKKAKVLGSKEAESEVSGICK